jgi:putative oxidoreductase
MKTAAILVARLIFAFVFAMAASFKFAFIGMDATAAEIAGAGFPIPHLLAWIAAFFEVALAIAFLTGIVFREAAVVAIAYVLFLGFSFHGPDRWKANPMEFGFFVDHFTFIAGLLFAAVHGPGRVLVLGRAVNLPIRSKA